MNFAFENQGTHTYLVYTVAEDDTVDSMSLGMLTNNKINGLAQTIFTQMDDTKYIKYDVSAKVSVKEFFSGQVNKKRLIGVFNGIVDAMLSAEDYMIDVNSIILDLEHIYADVSTCETVLVCLPIISNNDNNINLGVFFKNIMFTTQFDQTENCDHVAKIINYLNSSPVFSLNDFKKLLENIGDSASIAQSQQNVVSKTQMQQNQNTVQQNAMQQNQVQQAQPQTNIQNQQSFQQRNTPVKPTNNTKNVAVPVQQGNPEKKMSMLNLLMHYSKENAEIYKRQKAAKNGGQVQKPIAAVQQQKKQQPQTGFAIPGQQTSVQNSSVQSPMQQKPMQQNNNMAVNNQQTPYSQAPMPQGQSMNFGETTVLGCGQMGETTVLGAVPAAQTRPHLIREKNNEKIELNKPVFRIGKEKSYVDYFIGDNSAISRSHANIISRDGEYFAVDTNSTNHTYVNGQMIQSNVETKIVHGTKIKLGNENFEFRLY